MPRCSLIYLRPSQTGAKAMLHFSRRVSELFEQLDSPHAADESEAVREALLWLTTEARSCLELDLIEALDQRLSTVDVQPAQTNTTASKNRQRLVERVLAGESLRIAFINDNGFYAGAGIAMARQARSLSLIHI